MPDRHGRLFERLEPPPGGLQRLRARIERRARHHACLERLGYASAFALLLFLTAAVIVGPRRLKSEPPLPAFDQARLRLGMSSSPVEAMTIPASERTVLGAQRVPLQTNEVLFYLVASVAPDPKMEK